MANPLDPTVVGDTLACLDHALPPGGFDTPRVLDNETYQYAFTAWQQAVSSIETEWNRAADPANLTPSVPAAMHRAAELVRDHRPTDMSIEDADRLVDALQAPYPERVVRSIRAALGSADDPQEQVRTIAAYARDLGLQPSPPPEPLPEITDDDIHLVCWLAIVPSAGTDWWASVHQSLGEMTDSEVDSYQSEARGFDGAARDGLQDE
jgi:uncharacterized protein (DUF1778 family)